MKRKLLQLFSLLLITGITYAQQYELDNNFITGTGFNGEVNAMEFDSNNKLLVGGNFTDYNGTTVNYLVRLNTDGSLDATYTPALTAVVDDLTLHSDNSVTVVTAGALKRFTSDGSTDGTFSPVSLNSYIITIDAEPTGHRVVISGTFTSTGNYNNILRLNADGSIESEFVNNTLGVNGYVRDVEITSTGKIVVGGGFSVFNNPVSGGILRYYILQLNSDGSLDTNFDPNISTIDQVNNTVYSVAAQADGRVLAGTVYHYARLARLNTDGSKDHYGSTSKAGVIYDIYTNGTNDNIAAGSFEGGIGKWDYTSGTYSSIVSGKGIEGSTKEINAIAVQNDGSIIIGGDFTSYNGITTTNIARIAPCAVVINEQPNNATICENANTSFTLTASGTGNISYKWQVNTNAGLGLYTDISNGGVYSQATTNSLQITAAHYHIHLYL